LIWIRCGLRGILAIYHVLVLLFEIPCVDFAERKPSHKSRRTRNQHEMEILRSLFGRNPFGNSTFCGISFEPWPFQRLGFFINWPFLFWCDR